MHDNLPAHVESSLAEIGSITYASEVIAIIAGMAASEIDGVAAMGTASSIVDILGRNRKPITKGVKVEVGSEEASVDLVFSVEYGKPIQRVCRDVQESVRKAIETMTGLHVVRVDVHVLGVSFERETQQLAEGAQVANLSIEPGKRGQPVHARKESDDDDDDAPEEPTEAVDIDQPIVPAQENEDSASKQTELVEDAGQNSEDKHLEYNEPPHDSLGEPFSDNILDVAGDDEIELIPELSPEHTFDSDAPYSTSVPEEV